MREVYRLLSLARRYGNESVNTACGRALEVDVVSVTKIASMMEKAIENTALPAPRAAATGTARFARAAGLDPTMRLDTWDPAATVRFDTPLWNGLCSLPLVGAAQGALVLGPVGVGKRILGTIRRVPGHRRFRVRRVAE